MFAGAGGLTEGFRLGNSFRFVCHIEMDKDACSSLELRNIYYYLKNHDMLKYYFDYINGNIEKVELYSLISEDAVDDILNKEINQENMPLIFKLIDERLNGKQLDGIIGGPPCQAYSTIGRANNKSKKPTDKRIYLYRYYLEFLKKYNPRFFVFENVKGLLSFKDVKGELLFPKILEEFSKYGYYVDFKVINAKDFGVVQNRERLFLIGYRKSEKKKQSFFDYLEKYKEEAPVLKELFMDLPKLKAGEHLEEYRCINNNEYIKKYIRDDNDSILFQHIARPHNENDLKIYKLVLEAKKKGINLKYDDIPKQLQTHSNKVGFLDRYKALDYNSVSHTVVAHIAKDGHYYIHPDEEQNRSISVREAARIQGFPDNFYFEHSRTAAFKQIGNAVPPILSRKIACAINDFMGEK